jgi:hypothetical protein
MRTVIEQANIPKNSGVPFSVTNAEVMRMGHQFVGPNARRTSNGTGLHDPATGRTFRFPAFKPNQGGTYSNFQQKIPGAGESNVHVRVLTEQELAAMIP